MENHRGIFEGFIGRVSRFFWIPRDSKGFKGILRDLNGFCGILEVNWVIFEGYEGFLRLIGELLRDFWGILWVSFKILNSEGFKWILRDPWFCLKSYWGILYIGNFGWIVKKIGNNLAKINFNFEDISVKNEEQIDNFGVFYFWKLFLPIFVIFTKNWKFWISCSKIGSNLAKIDFNFGNLSVKNEEKIGNFGVFFISEDFSCQFL